MFKKMFLKLIVTFHAHSPNLGTTPRLQPAPPRWTVPGFFLFLAGAGAAVFRNHLLSPYVRLSSAVCVCSSAPSHVCTRWCCNHQVYAGSSSRDSCGVDTGLGKDNSSSSTVYLWPHVGPDLVAELERRNLKVAGSSWSFALYVISVIGWSSDQKWLEVIFGNSPSVAKKSRPVRYLVVGRESRATLTYSACTRKTCYWGDGSVTFQVLHPL